MSNYNSYGVHNTKKQPTFKKGELVKYKTNYRDTNGKLVFFYIYGRWNGTKAVFNDKDQHVVHTSWWLEKTSLKEKLDQTNIRKYVPYIPIIGLFIIAINPSLNYGLNSTLKSVALAIFQTVCIIGTLLLIALL